MTINTKVTWKMFNDSVYSGIVVTPENNGYVLVAISDPTTTFLSVLYCAVSALTVVS